MLCCTARCCDAALMVEQEKLEVVMSIFALLVLASVILSAAAVAIE